MHRRAFLVAAASLSAGCIGNAPSSTASSTPTTETPRPTQTTTQPTGETATTSTTKPRLNEPRSLTVSNLSQGNLEQFGLTANATLLENSFTARHPARIELELNATSKTTVSFWICRPGDIHEATATDTDDRLILKEGKPEQQSSDCWRIDYVNLSWGRPCFTKTVTITPNTPFTREFTIWDHPENTTCFPTGTYHVKDTPNLNDTVLHWSFDLTVST